MESRLRELAIRPIVSPRYVAPWVVALVALAAGCRGGCQGEGGDAVRVVPAETRAAVVFPSVEAVRQQLVAFLAGVEGASGALELADARYGVELRTPEGLRDVGIDPSGALTLFEHEGAVVLSVSVGDAGAFDELVASRSRKWAGAEVEAQKGPGGLSGVASAPPRPKEAALGAAEPRWRLGWGTTEDGVGLLVLTPGEGDPAKTYEALAGGAGGLAATEEAKAAAEGLGESPGAWIAVRRSPPIPEGLGPLGALLAPYLEPLSTWTGHAALEADRLTVRIRGAWQGEGAFPVGWFRPEGEAVDLARHFPKALTAFVRGRVDIGRVRNMPGFIRDRIVPEALPGPIGRLLPSPAEWLDLAAGDVAVALLGLDEEATVEQLVRAQRRPDIMLQLLHGAVGLRVRDVARARRLLERTRDRFREAGWTTAVIEGKHWSGFSFRRERPEQAWSALMRDDVLVLVSGSGEVERFLAVAEDRALPLTSMADDGVRQEALTGEDVGLGGLVTFTRITRELAEKGLPPYFLRIINDIRSVSVAFEPRDDGVDLALDVSL